MVLLKSVIWILLATGAAMGVLTQYFAHRAEQRFPPAGSFKAVNGVRLHHIEEPPGESPDLEPMVFIHGAGGNARDLHGAVADRLRGRARMIFVDRPGSGYSERGSDANADPARQAELIAALMGEIDIDRAVVVGHSLGAAVALALSVTRPEKVAGLVLVAPASHVWPGGDVTWYYRLAALPFVGRLFVETLAVPFGNLLYSRAVKRVFDPDPVPNDYAERSGTLLLLRPANFRSNARDVAALYGNVQRLSPRYSEISVPAVIVTGDSDAVVSPEYHAKRLAAAITEVRLIELAGAGHMPAHVRPDILVAEIERLNRKEADLAVPASGPAEDAATN